MENQSSSIEYKTLAAIAESDTHVNKKQAVTDIRANVHKYKLLALQLSLYRHATQGTQRPIIYQNKGWLDS